MSKSRKKSGCDCGSKDPVVIDPTNISKNCGCGKGGTSFLIDIKGLLIALAEANDDDNLVDIVLDSCPNHCFIEDARVIAVMDNTVVIKDDCCFRFICIGCICEVITDCETILDGLFEKNSINR